MARSRTWFLSLTLALTLLCFLGTYLLAGFYYEECEAFFNAFLSGRFTEGMPFDSWYYIGHIGLARVYSALYGLNGNVEWMSWILYTYLFMACAVLLYLAGLPLRNKWPAPAVAGVQVAVYVLLMADSVFHFQYTRVAYLMCAASLLSLTLYFRDAAAIRKRPWLFAALNLFFVAGTLTRLEASMAVTLLLLAFAVFYQGNLRATIRVFVFPVAVVLTVFAGILYDIRHTDSFYKQVEPDIETQITMRKNVVPVSAMKTERDSLRYAAAVNMMWSDPKAVDVKFLRSLLTEDSALFADSGQWRRTWFNVRELFLRYAPLLAFNLWLVLLYLYHTRRSIHPFRRLLWIGFQLAFVGLVLLETYTVKINERAFSPYVSIYTLANLLAVFTAWPAGRRWPAVWLAAVSLVPLTAACMLHGKRVSALADERETNRRNRQMLEQVAGQHTLVLNASSFRFFTVSHRPFEPFDFSAFGKVYINEAQVLPTIDAYRAYLAKECRCDMDDFSNFFRYLEHSGQTVYFLSERGRMQLIRDYLRGVRGYTLSLREVPTEAPLWVYDHEMAQIMPLALYTFAPVQP